MSSSAKPSRIDQRQIASRDPHRSEFIDAVQGTAGASVAVGAGVTVISCGQSGGGHDRARIEVEGVSDQEIRNAIGVWPQEPTDSVEAVTIAIQIRNWRNQPWMEGAL